MVASWPLRIKNHKNYSGLVNFNDFYATFSDILKVNNESDGKSLIDIFSNDESKKREVTSIYYDPVSFNSATSKFRNVFSQNERYKLYQNGKFFDMEKDVLETRPLNDKDLTENEKMIKNKLLSELKLMPLLPKE